MRCVRPLVVGISGPSRSGKTSLVAERQAQRACGRACGVIHQDFFFVQAEDAPTAEMETETGHTLTIANWEVPAAIRWPDLVAEVRRQVSDHTRKCDACLPRGPAAEAQAVECRLPPAVVFVEGFLVFANREVVELLDRRVLVVIGRAEARQRRLRTSGTTGLYFDRLIWPHCVDYTRQVLAAELQQPRQSEGGGDGPGADLLVLSGEDGMDENVRRLDAFVEGSGQLIESMTEGAAKLVEQLRAGNDQGETDASPPTVENADGLSDEQRTALKLYRDAEVLEAYGKRTEATALYRRALRMWPDVEEAASRDGDEVEHS